MLKRAAEHKGLAFIEIFQNCVIFNDGAFSDLTDKKIKEDHLLVLEHGQPMVFGVNKDKGIKLDGLKPLVVDISNGKYSINDLLVHDETDSTRLYAMLLAHLDETPGYPTPIGVYRKINKPTYDEGVEQQIENVTAKLGKGDLEKVLFSGNTWEVN
jgi:2-oxoglutarate ferredoxin oxidoreductase subunit beta